MKFNTYIQIKGFWFGMLKRVGQPCKYFYIDCFENRAASLALGDKNAEYGREI